MKLWLNTMAYLAFSVKICSIDKIDGIVDYDEFLCCISPLQEGVF